MGAASGGSALEASAAAEAVAAGIAPHGPAAERAAAVAVTAGPAGGGR
jgi:hypothetical protein